MVGIGLVVSSRFLDIPEQPSKRFTTVYVPADNPLAGTVIELPVAVNPFGPVQKVCAIGST